MWTDKNGAFVLEVFHYMLIPDMCKFNVSFEGSSVQSIWNQILGFLAKSEAHAMAKISAKLKANKNKYNEPKLSAKQLERITGIKAK